jgi:hypothetical protein
MDKTRSQKIRKYFHSLGWKDAGKTRYPLWAVLLAANEQVAAEGYRLGWLDATGENLRYMRAGQGR